MVRRNSYEKNCLYIAKQNVLCNGMDLENYVCRTKFMQPARSYINIIIS